MLHSPICFYIDLIKLLNSNYIFKLSSDWRIIMGLLNSLVQQKMREEHDIHNQDESDIDLQGNLKAQTVSILPVNKIN